MPVTATAPAAPMPAAAVIAEVDARVIAVDLAQTHDFTAISISDVHGDGAHAMHHVRHLERLQRGTSYARQIDRLREIVELVPGATLVVDQTGVGRPVVDMLRDAGLSPIAVTITAGDNVSRDHSDYRVPKRHLVTNLQIALQSRRLKVAASLVEARRWADELLAFQVEISASGRDTYGNDASLHAHDDLVIATALGVWWGGQRVNVRLPPPIGWNQRQPEW